MERHLRLHIKIYLTPRTQPSSPTISSPGHTHAHIVSQKETSYPRLDSRRMSPLCHCETRVHHHLGSRVRLVGRTGRSRVIASSRRDQRSKRFSVPSYSLPTRLRSPGHNSVWDAKAAKFLLNSRLTLSVQNISSRVRSSRWSLLCMCDRQRWSPCLEGVSRWLHTPSKLAFAGNGLLFSPSGESIFAHNFSTSCLWHTKDQIFQANNRSSFILEFSPDKTLAAFSRDRGNTVTVVDLQSGDPRLVVDAGMEIWCLGVTGSTIVVAGKEKIVTWNLPVGNCAFDARVDTNDSIRTTTFGHPLESISP